MTADPSVIKALTGIHVLVVDPGPDVRDLLESVFAYCGAFVTHAASTEEAIRLSERETPDVVVIDLEIADEEASSLRRLGTLRADRTVPVLAFVRGAEDERVYAGFEARIRKPADPWSLCRMLAGLVRKP